MDEVSRCCAHARVLASPIFHLRVFFFALTCDEQMPFTKLTRAASPFSFNLSLNLAL